MQQRKKNESLIPPPMVLPPIPATPPGAAPLRSAPATATWWTSRGVTGVPGGILVAFELIVGEIIFILEKIVEIWSFWEENSNFFSKIEKLQILKFQTLNPKTKNLNPKP